MSDLLHSMHLLMAAGKSSFNYQPEEYSLGLAWHWQVCRPAILLSDATLLEGVSSSALLQMAESPKFPMQVCLIC